MIRFIGRVLLSLAEVLLPIALALWLLWPVIRLPRPLPSLPAIPSALFAQPSEKPVRVESADCAANKKTCKDMATCEEAKFYLQHCDRPRLDKDHDGVPCEKLCQ